MENFVMAPALCDGHPDYIFMVNYIWRNLRWPCTMGNDAFYIYWDDETGSSAVEIFHNLSDVVKQQKHRQTNRTIF